MFDAAVNSGPGQAIRWLQRAVGAADDGIVGPLTLVAVRRLEPEAMQARYNGLRLDFMTRLSTWDTFSRGSAHRSQSAGGRGMIAPAWLKPAAAAMVLAGAFAAGWGSPRAGAWASSWSSRHTNKPAQS